MPYLPCVFNMAEYIAINKLINLLPMIELCFLGKEILTPGFCDRTEFAVFVSKLLSLHNVVSNLGVLTRVEAKF